MMPNMVVHTIDLHFQGQKGAIAAFLIEGNQGSILIETGPESCRQALLAGLAEKGIDSDDIAAVFVTHIHLDHAGGAGWWAQQGTPVFVHPKGARHLVDPSRLEASARQVYGTRFDELWGPMIPAPEEMVMALSDEEVITVAGLEVTAVETPGHCFHHHAFLLGDNLFAGDAVGASVDSTGFISVTSAPPQFHLEHTLSSIDRLVSLNPVNLYLTHFGSVDSPSGHLASYCDAVELNALFIQQRLAEGMDPDSLQVAYEAFQMEQAFRSSVSQDAWATLQLVNGTAMCADGIRLYWEKLAKDQT